MGYKSPKSKDRAKQQDTANKNQKKNAAAVKAASHAQPPAVKKGK